MNPIEDFAFPTAVLKALLTSLLLRLWTSGFSMGMTVAWNTDATLSEPREWLELGCKYAKMPVP